MKRRIIAIALAAFASPVLALEVGPPFEQAQLDRELPNIQFTPAKPYVADSRAPFEQVQLDRQLPNIEFAPVEPYVADSRAPYEQVQIDRALPNLPGRSEEVAGARGPGSARSDARSDLGDYFERQRQITDGYVQFIAQPQ